MVRWLNRWKTSPLRAENIKFCCTVAILLTKRNLVGIQGCSPSLRSLRRSYVNINVYPNADPNLSVTKINAHCSPENVRRRGGIVPVPVEWAVTCISQYELESLHSFVQSQDFELAINLKFPPELLVEVEESFSESEEPNSGVDQWHVQSYTYLSCIKLIHCLNSKVLICGPRKRRTKNKVKLLW